MDLLRRLGLTLSIAPLVLLVAVPARAGAIYLEARFDGAADLSGSGTAATGGPWDPDSAVEVGTGQLFIPSDATSSIYVDPGDGLGGSAKGLHMIDLSPLPGMLVHLDADAGNRPDSTAVYWVDYRFRLDPDQTDPGEPMVEVALFDEIGGAQIVRSWLGWFPNAAESIPYFRYAIFEGATTHKAELAPIVASDQWRALIKIDALNQTQTHWVWRNGETLVHPILATEYALNNPVAGATSFARLRYLSNNPADVEVTVDEILVSGNGPPVAPSGLKAVPVGTDRIQLSWNDDSTDETGFVIERSLNETGGWAPVQTVAAGVTDYLDTSLTTKTRYYYRVASVNAAGGSPWSNTTAAVTVYIGVPLVDWVDVTDPAYGADGQDLNDDTEELQLAINDAIGSWPQRPRVLYFPNGTYRISQTLYMEQQIGAQFVGESTDGVVIEWHGPPGVFNDNLCSEDSSVTCTTDADCDPTRNNLCGFASTEVMLHSDGASHSTWRNITWDARSVPFVVAFDQSYCGRSDTTNYNDDCTGLGNSWFGLSPDKGFADIGSAHIDSVYKNAWIGLRIGHYNVQDSEVTVRRCRFENNTAGVSIEDSNALNVWLWDSHFQNNLRGVTNAMNNFGGMQNNGAGDFRVLRARFLDNDRDVTMTPTGGFTFRECWSKGSGQFLLGHGSTGTSCRMTLIDNKIGEFDQAGQYNDRAIEVRNAGILLMVDNEIDTTGPAGPRSEPIFASTFNWSEILGLGNSYTTDDAYQGPNLRVRSIGDQLDVAPFDVTPPPLPVPQDPLSIRPIYTVTDGDNLQDVIDAAEAEVASALVHVPSGVYEIAGTVEVPAASDLVITGDGPASELQWTGTTTGPMIEIDGHQADGITVRYLQFKAKNAAGLNATAIEVRDLNQNDSRALLNRVLVINPDAPQPDTGIAVEVDGCDRTKVDVMDLNIDGELNNVGLQVKAGPQPQQGTAVWTGNMNSNEWDFDVVNNAAGVKLLVSSTYMEKSSHYLRARSDCGQGPCGSGDVCVNGAKAAAEATTDTATFFVDDFEGNIGIVNNSFWDIDAANEGARVEQVGSSPVEIQLLGNISYWEPEYTATSANVIRTSGNYSCIVPFTKDPFLDPTHPLCDLPCEPPCGAQCEPPAYPSCLDFPFIPLPDQFDPSTDEVLAEAGVSLLRDLEMPGFYDEPGASEIYQVNLDHLRIFTPDRGVLLSGGIPDDPSMLQATPLGTARVDLDWTDGSSDEDGFRIERSLSMDTGYLQIAQVAANDTTYRDGTVNDGARYYYRVAAYRNRTGLSGYTNRPDAVTELAAPTQLQVVTAGAGDLRLTWADNSVSEDGFRIERSTLPDSGFVEIDSTGAGVTTFIDTALVTGTRYYYRVRCFNAVAANSAYTNTAQGVVDSPGAVTQLLVDRSGTTLDLFWDASCSDQVVNYAIYEGLIGNWNSHGVHTCSTGGATFALGINNGIGNKYYLVVPQGATSEGSYGVDSAGAERPGPGASCQAAHVPGPCP